MQDAQITPYTVTDGLLIGGRSYLVDRFVPDLERIQLPAKTVAGGTLRFGIGPAQPRTEAKGWRQRLITAAACPVPHAQTIDLRRNTPSNWAHFLNNHLPITFAIADKLDLSLQDILLVLPQGIPSYIVKAAEIFDLKVMKTDGDLQGEHILYDVTPWTGIRPERMAWAALGAQKSGLGAKIANQRAPLPQKVFLSRKDSRILTNEDEVESRLALQGFEKIYAEDLSPIDQMRLFANATDVVAVHGAGLAPLLYAPAEDSPRRLIEILPCGHMTDVYRVMAQQMGWHWMGVRGNLKPAYIEHIYNFATPYTAHSLDAFTIDIDALEEALRLTELT